MTAETLNQVPQQRSRPYEADYYGWIEDQVALLKAGRLADIDAQNIAEEIKSVASRQYDRLEHAAQALIYNLLKWDLQPNRRSPSMVLSIDAHRDQIRRLLDRSPKLATRISEVIPDAYLFATYDVMRDDLDLPESTFASECPYNWHMIRNKPVEFDGIKSPLHSEHS